MGYYNWAEIFSKQSNSELLQIYNNRATEEKEKIEAIVNELKNRGVIIENDQKENIVLKKDTNDIKPNIKRAKIAVIFIWIYLGINIISIFSNYFQYDLIERASSGEGITTRMAEANDSRQVVIAVISIIIYIISGITFILWFRRAYYNLHTKTDFLAYSEGWASGGWFVPIGNLYIPFKIMRELYTGTPDILKAKIDNFTLKVSKSLVGWWWTLWILSSLIGQFVFQYSRHYKTIDGLKVSTIASLIGDLVIIPLSIITVYLIVNYSKLEILLANGSGDLAAISQSEVVDSQII